MLHPEHAGADAIGETAFLAHLMVKPRAHRAGAIGMVHDVGREEIRIVARKAGAAEVDDSLRNVEVHDNTLAQSLHGSGRDGLELRLFGKAAKDAVDDFPGSLGIEI